MKVTLLDYGAGNVQSVQFALQRLDIEPLVTNNIEDITTADKIIFPGVGAANQAMSMLKKSKLDVVIPQLKQDVLGICLGMQLLCDYTEEGQTNGMGVFKTSVKQFSNDLKVPHMGWNTISALSSKLFNGLEEQSYMYSVHSYYASIGPETIACSTYGIAFSAALQRNNFYGVQFHPEKSGREGALILQNFLTI